MKVTEIYAYVMADKDPDDEGIPAFKSGDMAMPMVGADMERAESMRPIAQGLANQQGKQIRLLKFTHMEVVDVLEPRE